MTSRFENIQFSALARAGEGLTQWRPLVMGFITMVVCGLLVVASQWLATSVGGMTGAIFFGLAMLLVAVVFFSGISAVGVMLMDKAQNVAVRGFSDAAFAGLLCVPKFLGLMLLSFFAALLFYLVAAIIYFICKIPVLGAVLAFVVHPVLIVVASVLIVAWMCVIMPLFAPAVWSGLGFKAALASVVGIARSRLVEVVLMQVVLYFIMMVITGLLLMGLLPAAMSLTGMGASVMGVDLADLGIMVSSMGQMGSVAGLVMGLGVLLGVIAALLWQVAVMGQNLLYLQANASIDSTQAEAALNGVWNDVRKRAEDAKDRAMTAAERAKQIGAEKAQEVAAANEARKVAAAEQAQQQAVLAAEREAARLKAEAAQQAHIAATAQMDAEQQARDAAIAAQQEAAVRAAEKLQAQEQANTQRAAEQVASQQAAQLPACTQCQELVSPSDVFCGNCGKKLH